MGNAAVAARIGTDVHAAATLGFRSTPPRTPPPLTNAGESGSGGREKGAGVNGTGNGGGIMTGLQPARNRSDPSRGFWRLLRCQSALLR